PRAGHLRPRAERPRRRGGRVGGLGGGGGVGAGRRERAAHRAAAKAVRGVIEIDLTLPLAHFTLAVRCTLAEKVTALVGPSGSGKTSLIESMAGLRPRASGRVV